MLLAVVSLLGPALFVGQLERLQTDIALGPRPVIEGSGASVAGQTLQITSPRTFRLTGDYVGSVVVDVPEGEVTLVLAGATIHNPDGPVVHVISASSVTIELAVATTNYLSDGGESELDAAIYAESPLTITGSGALTVNAVYEGMSSTSDIVVEGGSIAIHAGEDGLNASEDGASRITINGGHLYIDGIDSNGTIEITGGTVIAYVDLSSGESGLDADGGITITGGTVVATATRAPIPLRTPGTQKALIMDVLPVPRVGDLLVVTQTGGGQLLAFEAVRRYSRLIFSSAEVVEGRVYDVYLKGSVSGEPSHGLHSRVLDLGELVATVRPGVVSLVGEGHPGVIPRR